jgi:hypothetical protein
LIDLLKSRLVDLKKKSFSELSQLAPYQAEKIRQGKKLFTVAIWKDSVNETELRVVIQVYRPFFLGIGRMAADGFRIQKNNAVEGLSREELYEFT